MAETANANERCTTEGGNCASTVPVPTVSFPMKRRQLRQGTLEESHQTAQGAQQTARAALELVRYATETFRVAQEQILSGAALLASTSREIAERVSEMPQPEVPKKSAVDLASEVIGLGRAWIERGGLDGLGSKLAGMLSEALPEDSDPDPGPPVSASPAPAPGAAEQVPQWGVILQQIPEELRHLSIAELEERLRKGGAP